MPVECFLLWGYLMDLLDAIILGLIQGITEFLPISSSGHLVLAQFFLGIKSPGILLEIILHLGTLFSIIVFYRMDLLLLYKNILKGNNDSIKLLYMIL